MRAPKPFLRLTALLCAAILLSAAAPATRAQRRRRAPAPQRPAQPAPARAAQPAPQTPGQAPPRSQGTARRPEPDLPVEELIAADAYTVYAELRRVGTLAQAEEVKSAVASLRLLAGDEMKPLADFHAFLLQNAEALGESRMVLCFMPARAGVPQALGALELTTPEAAAAFEPKFRRLLGEQVRRVKQAAGVGPEAAPYPGAGGGGPGGGAAKPAAAAPDFALRRVGRWLVYADSPFKLKGLRGEEDEPRLADSTRFQAARGRFSNDALFVYVDTDVAQRGWALQMQQARQVAEANAPPPDIAVVAPEPTPQPAESPSPEQTPAEGETAHEQSGDVKGELNPEVRARLAQVEENLKEAPPAPEPSKEELAVRGLGRVMGSLWGGAPRIPGAVALGVGLDRGALALRLGVENTPDGTVALIPFMPNLISGPPVTADSASVAPADAEFFVAGSLDWAHVYNSTLGAASVNTAALLSGTDEEGEPKPEPQPSADETIAAVEKLFGFKFREDLLPSLGSEVGFSMPLDAADFRIGPRGPSGGAGEEGEKKERDAEPGPLFYVSLNDQAKMREILPRVLVAFGIAPLGAPQPQAEKREGVEIHAVGASDALAYAFVGNYLVAGELKAVRYCVDSFSTRQTLAASNAYRDSVAWQAKQKLFHVYISDAIARRVVSDTTRLSGGSTDPVVRALLAQLAAAEYAPASYEATNEGDLVMHEARLPLSLVRSYALAATVAAKDAPVLMNESLAANALRRIEGAEMMYKDEKKKGRYGTIEELVAEELLEKGFPEHVEYAIELKVTSEKFEATATPKSYGKTGRRSFFLDETGQLRAADRKGQPATPEDPKEQ